MKPTNKQVAANFLSQVAQNTSRSGREAAAHSFLGAKDADGNRVGLRARLKGAALSQGAALGMGAGALALHLREEARLAPQREAFKGWAQANKAALDANYYQNRYGRQPPKLTPALPAPSNAPPPPAVSPGHMGLRQALGQAIPRVAVSLAKQAPVTYAASAGLEGAMRGLRTPTEVYAQRQGVPVPGTFAGDLAVRGRGVLGDVVDAALLRNR